MCIKPTASLTASEGVGVMQMCLQLNESARKMSLYPCLQPRITQDKRHPSECNSHPSSCTMTPHHTRANHRSTTIAMPWTMMTMNALPLTQVQRPVLARQLCQEPIAVWHRLELQWSALLAITAVCGT